MQPGSPQVQINVGGSTTAPSICPLARYYIAVRGYTSSGLVGPASEVSVDLGMLPGPPTAFQANVSGTRVTLSWNPPATGGFPLYYLLSAGTAPGASNLASNLAVGNVQSVSESLPPGTYFARVRAVNASGPGPFTADLSFQVTGGLQPLNPTGLGVTWNGTVATFTWQAPVSDDPRVIPATYLLEAGSRSGIADLAHINVGAGRSYSVDVPPGTFYVRVRGVNALGTSGPSNEVVVSGRGAPNRPGTPSASGTGGSVTLRWSPPSRGTAATGYVLEAGSAPGLSNLATLNVGNVTAFTTAVAPGTYYVRVRAVNARGASPPSNEVVVRR